MSLTKATYSMIDGAIVNVLDYGAVGDGSTDDAAAIIAAVAALPNGGTVFFPKGTYIIGRAIPLSVGIHYLGESANSTVLKAADASWDNILGYGYPTTAQQNAERDIIIENLTFDGNKANRTENQLQLSGTGSGVFIDGETVASSGGGTAVCAAHDVPVTFITLDPATVTGTFAVGNVVTGVTSGATLTISSKSADDAYQTNLRAQSLKSSVIRNCKFINSFFSALSLYNNCERVLVDNCLIYDNNKSGTVLSSPYNVYIESYAKDVIISNCWVNGGEGNGITLRGGVCRGVKIINNTVSNTVNYGIEVSSDASNIISDTVISGNTLYAAPNAAADSIVVWGNTQTIYGTVIANNVIDTGTEPIALRGNLDGVVAVGNVSVDCTLPTVVTHGSGIINYTFAANTSNDPALDTVPTVGASFQFPATPVLSVDPNTLDEYTEYTAASAACSGAITTAAVWSLTKIGNLVTLHLPTVTGTASAASGFDFGTAIPAAYRPPANVASFSARIINNGSVQAASGMIFVAASTGVITVQRDGTGTNFSAGATGGLGSAVSISWAV